ncbi:MAG: peptidase S41 [Planctomycetes bacterium]|nr:peptidase S41 [Planctomycetota bacterium]
MHPHGGMLRFPDVSATHVAFVYADDLWMVPREGGVALPLASPAGVEGLPRFSADGQTIAFTGNYDGNRDLYTLPVAGGVPTRVTHHPAAETLCGWTPDGRLLFFTNGLTGRNRQVQLFTVGARGGLPEPLPVPYGAFADISSDGRWLAYTPHTTDNRTWKRYRGGMSTDIWLFDLRERTSKRATTWEGTDTAPMWHGSTLYYLSDDGSEHRQNLWSLDPATLARKQLTKYADFDVKWPALGPGPKGAGEIVFQHGSRLELYDLALGETRTLDVTIPGARAKLKPRLVDAAEFAQGWDVGPSGKRVLISARGDVWSVPAKEGSARNLTRSSGVAERDGSWSPDGKWVAYLSDASGEYEVVLAPADQQGEAKTLTRGGSAFRRLMVWSPDSKQLVFCDKTGTLYLLSAEGGEPRVIEKDSWSGDLIGVNPSFSRDSRWLTYASSDADSGVSRLVIYEVPSATRHVVTAGMFDDASPVFDRKGDTLYFRRRGHFAPLYGETDTSFLYAGTEQLCVVTLRADQPSPFAPKSDEEGGGEEKDDEKKDGEKKDGEKDGDADKDGDEKKEKEPEKPVEIALDGFEQRAVLLPIDPGVFGSLAVNDAGALLYVRSPIQGVEGESAIQLFDVNADESSSEGKDGGKGDGKDGGDDGKREKLVAKGFGAFALSGDGKKILAFGEGGPQIGDAKADTKLAKLGLDGLEVEIDPRAEWRQIFSDAWRMMRDFFYDPGMHGVDWAAVREQYAAMLDDCASREDLSYVIREMISELNVGHAYYSGGDVGDQPARSVGLLGCDYLFDQGAYKIARIHAGGPWDADARGPLSQPGVNVKVGDYLLAVNGVPLDPTRDPWAAFQGLAEKTVTLTVSAKPVLDAEARAVVVETLADEQNLRYRAWIEQHRRAVAEKTDGRVGYLYVPSTGIDGQNDLVRQFQGQLRKDALIIDERWNSGGQIPTRFVELLNRPATNYWARRDGHDWPWPPDAHFGPKCMLINGLSGSGGDAFPFYFKQAGLGKLIGMRTWGGLVGLSGYPALIDGGDIECPSFAFYETDGTWGVEGHGVDPDLEVIDDPALMQDGADPQLERAIALMLQELEDRPYVAPKRPAYPDRRGMGLDPKDK